jgi:Uma2 family endonuclease
MAVRDSVSRRFTYEDYLLFPEDGCRHELIKGEHFVTPAPSTRHQAACISLGSLLFNFLRRHPLGRVLPAPFEVVLSDRDVVQPDLVFISHERLGILTEHNAQGAPDLAVEVLSRTTRRTDETRKLRLYERSGVREVWLVDPDLQTVKVYRQDGDRLVQAAELRAATADVLATPLLPGLEIPLSALMSCR